MTNELPTKEQYTDFARAAGALLDTLPAWKKASADDRRAKIIEIATGGQGAKLEDVIHLDEALDKVRAWVAAEHRAGPPRLRDAPAQLPAPEQTTAATDWLVSVTPKNGDLVTPSGLRFCYTAHNGATAEMILALALEMDRAYQMFAQYGIKVYELPAATPVDMTPAQPRGNSGASPRTATPPAVQNGGEGQGEGQGYDVFGVGRCFPGKTYEVAITRIKAGATTNNSPTVDLYRTGDKFRFLSVFERQFPEFMELTGIDPAALDPRQEQTVNFKAFFRLATDTGGAVKTTSQGNPRIDFAGIA